MNFIKCQYCEFLTIGYEIPDGCYGFCSFADIPVRLGDSCREQAVEESKERRRMEFLATIESLRNH